MTQYFHSEIDSHEKKTYIHTKTYTWMFTAALFKIAPKCKQPKCSSTEKKDERRYLYHRISFVHKKEWSTVDMDEPWKQYALRERKKSQKISYCMKSSFIWSVHNGQIYRERLVFAWLLRALWYRGGVWMESGKNGKVESDCCVYRISFHDDENVLKWIMVMVVQLCEYKKNWVV